MADALDLGSSAREGVGVQVPPFAPYFFFTQGLIVKLKLMYLSLFSLNAFGAVIDFPPHLLALFRKHCRNNSSGVESSSSPSSTASNQHTPATTMVRMPSAAILKKRLLIKTGILIGEKTSLIEKLADQAIEPMIIAAHIELAMGDYVDYIKAECGNKEAMATELAKRAQAKMPLVFAAVFEENPECLPELKNQGIAYALPSEESSKS